MAYCDRCRASRPEGPRFCPECGARLSDEAARSGTPGLSPVLRTSDANLLPIVQSLLDAAGIPYVIQGGQALGLFPLGPFGGGVLRRVLGATVLVPETRAEEARALLADLEADGESGAGQGAGSSDARSSGGGHDP